MERKEALEVVRKNMPTDRSLPVYEALQTLIPELAESEDERIRRTLVEYFGPQVQLDFVRGVPTQKIRDWLEKQKERQDNPNAHESSWPGLNTISSQDKDKNLDEIAQDYVDGVKEYNPEPTWDLMQTAVCYGYHYREQKEQKPEEKSINWTELTWKDIVELEGIINNVHYEFRNGIGQESFGKEVLEKFREYKGDEYLDEIEQKPADRLEEAREKYQVEWSEEEEKIIEGFYTLIRGIRRAGGLTLNKVPLDKCEALLKSLRPSWKPSEEQMKILYGILVGCRGTWGKDTVTTMESLYQDLKELM